MILSRTLRLMIATMFCVVFVAACQTSRTDTATSTAAMPQSAKADPRARDLYFSVIAQLIDYGKYHAALAHLDECDRLYGPKPRSHGLRGDAWLALGEFKNAETEYGMIARGPMSGYGLHGLGSVAAARGDWDHATEFFESAVKAQPTNTSFLNDLGRSYTALGRSSDAEFTLRKALELSPAGNRRTVQLLADVKAATPVPAREDSPAQP